MRIHLSGAVLAATLFLGAQVWAKENTMIVRAIRGIAEYSVDGTGWKKLRLGERLGEGSWVRTGEESTVDLFEGANASIARLTPDTTMKILELRDLARSDGDGTATTTRFDFKAGRMFLTVKKLSIGSLFEIQTPRGVIRLTEPTTCGMTCPGILWVFTGKALLLDEKSSLSYLVGADEWFDPDQEIVRDPEC